MNTKARRRSNYTGRSWFPVRSTAPLLTRLAVHSAHFHQMCRAVSPGKDSSVTPPTPRNAGWNLSVWVGHSKSRNDTLCLEVIFCFLCSLVQKTNFSRGSEHLKVRISSGAYMIGSWIFRLESHASGTVQELPTRPFGFTGAPTCVQGFQTRSCSSGDICTVVKLHWI